MKNILLKFERLAQKGLSFQRYHDIKYLHSKEFKRNRDILTAKEIRNLFLEYFVKEKNHTYVHSSPIFLNYDPTLLFVNAGMNQFRSLLLNTTQPGHPFYNLKKAANSQKCIRLSGKHNDLADVGKDLHHHTFFEMLGNWSFGDYTKKEACKMSWELLTKIYHIEPERLYVTYFGGDENLSLSADEECRNIWLEIGVPPDHIFSFGAAHNFWEMGDKGPCGPCTEIHYDYFPRNNDLSPAQRINADRSDFIEVWNLVFIQYNRDTEGRLQNIPHLNIDTGMGFERVSAILQGTMSNYDTDIFQPLFQAIEKNFKVKPYGGKMGNLDVDGLDTAYRIIADHSRMFTVAIADGVFPDAYDAGHVLRKIIRRAAYASNRVLKSRPGILSSLVPYVAESLDHFPEIQNNINEIVAIVNEEEKLFHQVINRGRKARNKMMSGNNSTVLSGDNFWKLHHNYGLEENVVQDLASEINLTIDWDDYKKISDKKNQLIHSNPLDVKRASFETAAKTLKDKSISCSDDTLKYHYSTEKGKYGVKEVTSQIVAIHMDGNLADTAKNGTKCVIVTDKTNFYSIAGGQEADIGQIYNQDFTFTVSKVYSHLGYVFHEGVVSRGDVNVHSIVQMSVDKDHRIGCSRNHTATHLLNSAVKTILPYSVQRSSSVGSKNMQLGFSSKAHLSEDQVEEIEDFVNNCIKQELTVSKTEMPFETLLNIPNVTFLRGEEYPKIVKVISIGNENNNFFSVEPCCGTHVHNTADIVSFLILPYKSAGGATRVLNCVTGDQAIAVSKNDKVFWNDILRLEARVETALTDINISEEDLHLLLKEVKKTFHECHMKNDISLKMQTKCEKKVQNLKLKLSDMINSLNEETNLNCPQMLNESNSYVKIMDSLQASGVPKTNDSFKYLNFEGKVHCIKPLTAKIISVYQNELPIKEVFRGQQCQVITDKTNFYSEEDDQACDKGLIIGKNFVFQVSNVKKVNGYIIHDGWVETGNVLPDTDSHLLVNEENRLACSQNHSALHLLNSVLKQVLPYAFQCSAVAGPNVLQLRFSSKVALSDDQLIHIEHQMNKVIKENLQVSKSNVPLKELKTVPAFKAALIKEFEENVPVVSIGNDNSSFSSTEPCCGTHVATTSDIGQFIITTYKTYKNTERTIQGVTGKTATDVEMDGKIYNEQMTEIENHVFNCLGKEKADFLELWDCLKEVKSAKAKHDTDLPLLMFKSHQNTLSELTEQLTISTQNFVEDGFLKVKNEMQSILKASCQDPFLIHKLDATGDGKKIVNFALDCVQNKPAMFFASDGHKSIVCSCSVPKENLNPSFSALLWIQPLAELIEGHTRTTVKNPELHYSITSHKTDKIDEAIKLAKKYAMLHL